MSEQLTSTSYNVRQAIDQQEISGFFDLVK